VANVETSDVRYVYDALDRRIRRKADTNNNDTVFEVSDRLLYDTNPVLSALPRFGGEGQGEGAFASAGFHELIQTINEVTGNRNHRFLNGPQPDMVLVDEVFNGTGTPTDILWLLHDHQNTVTDVATMSSTSGQATLRNHLEYNAFGAITSQTNSAYAPLQTYTGQILDTVTGLLFYDARWYDPKLGRFVSEDPIGFAAGDANLSRYVGNGFPNATDPSGLDDESPFWEGLKTGMEVFFVDEIYGGGKAVVTGDAGRAMGDRAVNIVENRTGREFSGTAGDYGRFAFDGVAGDLSGVNSAVEAGSGIDLSNETELSGMERTQRGFLAVGAAAGNAAGGLSVAAKLAPTTCPTAVAAEAPDDLRTDGIDLRLAQRRATENTETFRVECRKSLGSKRRTVCSNESRALALTHFLLSSKIRRFSRSGGLKRRTPCYLSTLKLRADRMYFRGFSHTSADVCS